MVVLEQGTVAFGERNVRRRRDGGRCTETRMGSGDLFVCESVCVCGEKGVRWGERGGRGG